MKAHIRKMPTKMTYLNRLADVMSELGKYDISPEIMNGLETKLASDEYYQKMKEAFSDEAGTTSNGANSVREDGTEEVPICDDRANTRSNTDGNNSADGDND